MAKKRADIIEFLPSANNKRVKFITDAAVSEYSNSVRVAIQRQLMRLPDEEQSVDRVYQQLAGVLLTRKQRIQNESLTGEVRTALHLIDQYRHVDFEYQHPEMQLTTSPLDSQWKDVTYEIQWSKTALTKMNLQRKQRELAFVTSLTQAGEHMRQILEAFELDAGQTRYFTRLFLPTGGMIADEGLLAILTGDFQERLQEAVAIPWSMEFNVFFSIPVTAGKFYATLPLTQKLIPLRKIILDFMEKIDMKEVRRKLASVAYEYLWPRLYGQHLCSRLQLLAYVGRVCSIPTDEEISAYKLYYKIKTL